MNTSAFLRHLTVQPTYGGQIAHIEHIPPQDASCAELAKPLVSSLQGCLDEYGLSPLLTHQAGVVDNVRQGKSVMVLTVSAINQTPSFTPFLFFL